MIIYQYCFINWNICIILTYNIDDKGNWEWSVWGLSVLSPQFLYKSKTVLQNKIYLECFKRWQNTNAAKMSIFSQKCYKTQQNFFKKRSSLFWYLLKENLPQDLCTSTGCLCERPFVSYWSFVLLVVGLFLAWMLHLVTTDERSEPARQSGQVIPQGYAGIVIILAST